MPNAEFARDFISVQLNSIQNKSQEDTLRPALFGLYANDKLTYEVIWNGIYEKILENFPEMTLEKNREQFIEKYVG